MIIRTKSKMLSLLAAFASLGLGGVAGALAPTYTAAVVIIALTAMLWALALVIGALAGHAMGWSIWALGLSVGTVTGVAICGYHPGSGSVPLAVAACASIVYIGIEVMRVVRGH